MKRVNKRVKTLRDMGFNNIIDKNEFVYTINKISGDTNHERVCVSLDFVRHSFQNYWEEKIVELNAKIREQTIDIIINE
tara:strand:- start:34335 stop:34571 length:237 start_codon:yes stop_codon:yes gene_type:complete